MLKRLFGLLVLLTALVAMAPSPRGTCAFGLPGPCDPGGYCDELMEQCLEKGGTAAYCVGVRTRCRALHNCP